MLFLAERLPGGHLPATGALFHANPDGHELPNQHIHEYSDFDRDHNPNQYRHVDTNQLGDRDSHQHGNGNSVAHRVGDEHVDRDKFGDLYPNAHSDGDALQYAYPYGNIDSDRNTDAYADCHTNGYLDRDPKSYSHSNYPGVRNAWAAAFDLHRNSRNAGQLLRWAAVQRASPL